MAILSEIENKILSLDPTLFHVFCDVILKKKYPNYSLNSYGREAGESKSIKGNPDSVFTELNGNCICAVYTTEQQGSKKLISKFEKDIDKIFKGENSACDIKKVQAIYCCFTQRFADKDFDLLRNRCREKEISLNVWGINEIAVQVSTHRDILRDYLGIEVDTEQIYTLEKFIEKYDNNKMAVPLSTTFSGRETEIKDIKEKLDKNNVVVLTGEAGVGKTRLAIEVARQTVCENYWNVYCVKNNGRDIRSDISHLFENEDNFILMLDDANETDGLKYIFEKLQDCLQRKKNIKIIVTVREYVLEDVRSVIEKNFNIEIVNICNLNNETIYKILQENLEIKNLDYLQQISTIGQGNIRIAYMAGKLVVEGKKFVELLNFEDVLRKYYGEVIQNSQFDTKSELRKTAVIMSILRASRLDDKFLLNMLQFFNLSKDKFDECISELERQEFVDIKYEKAVKIADQCFAQYLIFYSLIKKKDVDFYQFIKCGFSEFRGKLINVIHLLMGVFRTKEVEQIICDNINKVWTELEQEKSALLFDYIKEFKFFNIDKTLLFVRNEKDVSAIIILLSDLHYSIDNLQDIFDLLFDYMDGHPEVDENITNFICNNYKITDYSGRNKYCVEIKLFENIIKKSQENSRYEKLFLNVAGILLAYSFDFAHFIENRKFVSGKIDFYLSDEGKRLREIIWYEILELASQENYRSNILNILGEYPKGTIDVANKNDILKFDLPYIFKILKSIPNNSTFDCLYVVSHLQDIINCIGCECEYDFNQFLQGDKWILYQSIKHHDFWDMKYEEVQKKNQEILQKYGLTMTAEKVKKVVVLANEIVLECENVKNEINNGLMNLFSVIDNFELVKTFVKVYVECGKDLDVCPAYIIYKHIQNDLNEEIRRIIFGGDFPQKQQWKYYWFSLQQKEDITKDICDNLCQFFNEEIDSTIKHTEWKNLTFLENYWGVDKEIYCKIGSILIEGIKRNSFFAGVYMTGIFVTENVDFLQEKFYNNLPLLQEIYMCYISNCAEKYPDYQGKLFAKFVSTDLSWIDKFLDFVFTGDIYKDMDRYSQLYCCWDNDNYEEIFNKVMERFFCDLKNSFLYMHRLRAFLCIDVKNKNVDKQKSFLISWTIKLAKNSKIVEYFEFVAECGGEFVKICLQEFLKHNEDIEIFKHIQLFSYSESWTGSAVPLKEQKINFLNSILEDIIPKGNNFLEHRVEINNRILELEHEKEEEKIRDVIEEDFR